MPAASSKTVPQRISGQLVDLHTRSIYGVHVDVEDGVIRAIERTDASFQQYLLPGLIDAHVHVESSMLVPSQFARAAVRHGTVATVSDPHEIANVLGAEGVRFMLDDAARAPLKIYFGVPSCVPATSFETAGAEIDASQVAELLDDPRLVYLSEMMNYPGVLHGDEQVAAKIAAARQRGKPIDGHAPGLRGAEAARYIAAGITTDHECTSRDEAVDKLDAGALILIREGSAARNFAALHSLIDDFPGRCMWCTDDKHPDELETGHIDALVRRALTEGHSLWNVLQAACVTPVEHYGLRVGLLRVGDPADLIVVDNLEDFRVQQTYIDGELVAEHGQALFDVPPAATPNRFATRRRSVDQFGVTPGSQQMRVIEVRDGELVTGSQVVRPRVVDGWVVSDVERDVLKIAVVNRYSDAPPAVAFVTRVGLQRGAIASSVAHDSHNIVAVGVDDADLCAAVNQVIDMQGGLAAVAGGQVQGLPLPVAGLMSPEPCEHVGAAYRELDAFAKQLGSPLRAPFMTLSFLALLVIPELKLSDLGLFDGARFDFSPLFL